MLQSLVKGWNTKFLWRKSSNSNDIFLEKKWSAIQHCKRKSNHVLKNAGKWPRFTLQTKYLVDILSSLHDVLIMVHIVLQLGESFEPNWHKTSFAAPGPKVKVFFKTWLFDWIQLMILDKMDPFGKIGARVLDLWLDMSFGPKQPRCSF